MTGRVQLADISAFMLGQSENQIEALVSQSVIASKKQLDTINSVFALLAGVKR